MSVFCIWVDADSCPVVARDFILKQALIEDLSVVYVANKKIPFSQKSQKFDMIIVEKGKDKADDYICEHCKVEDIVVTRDILFAARLVKLGMTVINDRGILFDVRTAEKMVKERELSQQMESLGLHTGKVRYSYGKKEEKAFKECLLKVLELKKNPYSYRPL